jgi:hypothetical protein
MKTRTNSEGRRPLRRAGPQAKAVYDLLGIDVRGDFSAERKFLEAWPHPHSEPPPPRDALPVVFSSSPPAPPLSRERIANAGLANPDPVLATHQNPRSNKVRPVHRLAFSVVLLLCLCGGAATPAVSQQTLPLSLVSVTSPVRHGHDATIVVATSPAAACTITVLYKTGASRAGGLVLKTADPQGRVAWTWRVGTRTTPGTWPIIVTCSLGNRQSMLRTPFEVI